MSLLDQKKLYHRLRKWTKNITCRILIASGIFYLLRKKHSKHIGILMLHGITGDEYQGEWSPLWERVKCSNFEKGLKLLKRYHTIISMDHAISIIKGERTPVSYGLVLTFDDGYKNFQTYVLPILQKTKTEATVYVVTNYVSNNKKRFWVDELDYLIQKISLPEITINVEGNKYSMSLIENSREKLANMYRKFRLSFKNNIINDVEANHALNALIKQLSTKSKHLLCGLLNDQWSAIMDWQALKEISQNKIVIGSHTENHYRLTLVHRDVASLELKRSKLEIEKHLGRKCVHFCYPNGDYNEKVVGLVEEADYMSALSTQDGLNCIGDNIYSLKRIPFPDFNYSSSALFRVNQIA